MMKKLTFRFLVALIAFCIGITMASFYFFQPLSQPIENVEIPDCIPFYDSKVESEIRKRKLKGFFNFKEMPFELLPPCVDEAYRLIWIPTFHPSVSVRVWRSEQRYFISVKQLNKRIGNLELEKTRMLSESEWNEIKSQIVQSNFWQTPTQIYEPVLQDGATWIMDGLKNKQLHSVQRISPDDKFGELLRFMIGISELKTEHDSYL